jgi:hypothetical protein
LSVTEILFLLLQIRHSIERRAARGRRIDDSPSSLFQIFNTLLELDGAPVTRVEKRRAAVAELVHRIGKLQPTIEEARELRAAIGEATVRSAGQSRSGRKNAQGTGRV